MEKWHDTWKNLVATKNSPWTPRFGGPSLQFKIIFQKKNSSWSIVENGQFLVQMKLDKFADLY